MVGWVAFETCISASTSPVGWASSTSHLNHFSPFPPSFPNLGLASDSTPSRFQLKKKIHFTMAPSALADIYPIPARHYSKHNTVVASVLHGPRDLRLVCVIAPASSDIISHPNPAVRGGSSILVWADSEANSRNRKLGPLQIPDPTNSRSLSKPLGSAGVMSPTTTSSATVISRPCSRYL